MNVIFGGGLVALMAKKFLGPDWSIVPFGRSRYYSYQPPLADNVIGRDRRIDRAMATICGHQPAVLLYGRGLSVAGAIVRQFEPGLIQRWATKVFGAELPSQVPLYWRTRSTQQIYDVRASDLYCQLQAEYLGQLKSLATCGTVSAIGAHWYELVGPDGQKRRVDFERAISTLPADIMAGLCNLAVTLPARTEQFVHVASEALNFEGCNQLFVVDDTIAFYKVINVAPGRYVFYFADDHQDVGRYLMDFITPGDILDGTSIARSLPAGEIPILSTFESYGIFSVGSHAQWDSCACLGSNLLRLVNYAERGFTIR